MKMSLSKLIVATVCVLCVLVVVLAPAEAVSAQEALPVGSLESPLVPGLGVGGGQQAAEEAAAARLSSPEALAEDARSRTEYSGYGRAAAAALAKRLFEVGESQSELPQAQDAAKITGYIGEDAAAETLPSGSHLLLDSSMPLRSALGSGHLAPVSLALTSTESGYEPANPLVPVVISKNASEGVSFQFGLRVMPVQDEAPEPSQLVGDSVFYRTAKDTDFMLEPVPSGVEASWQILSAEGSAENALSFKLPAGASLVLSKRIQGAAEVLLEGRTLLLVMPASATEADGASLPVSFTVSGDTLTTHVDLSGNVAFPVMVDPLITQEYGGGSGYWDGWGESGTEGAFFEGGSGNSGVLAGLKEGYGNHAWAAREIYAPGWSTGEGSITRIDVRGLGHYYGPSAPLETGIEGGKATRPVWTFNGTIPTDTKEGQLNTGEELRGRAATFCAVGAGGYDGGSQPLCNESDGGNYYHLSIYGEEPEKYTQYVVIENTWVKFIDSSKITGNFATGTTTAGGYTNALGSGKPWFGPASKTHIEYSAVDNAFGVASMTLQRWTGSEWATIQSNNYESEGGCDNGPSVVQCGPDRSRELDYENLAGHLVNGENKLRLVAKDPSGVEQISSEPVLNVDSTPPQITLVAGADTEGETINVTEGQAGNWIHVQAKDEHSGVWGSGISSLAIEVDNKQIGGNQGSCTEPCTGNGWWTLNGAQLGAGVHSLTVVATDNAGNIEHKTYELIVHAAAPVAMGPGSVNPESGDFALESTDVDLKDSAGDLTITRHYDSRNVKEGAQGPLGPQWSIGLGELASLEVIENEGKVEAVMVVGPEGLSYFPAKEGGGFEAPPGDSSLSLTLINSGSEYLLEDKKKGTSTTFTKAGSTNQWMPTISKTTVATDKLTDTYTTVEAEGKTIVEPTEELAPHSTAKCPAERSKLLADEEAQAKACRALFFYYGSEDSSQPEAKGENESEWGWHANRLTKVVAVVWSTSAGKMDEEAVAEYSYDREGRLRAEWDPRIKPLLKTIYGYDSEGQVTAVSPPGQQPWLMTYGTAAEDPSAGRLIKVMRPKASTTLWAGRPPAIEEAPVISGGPALEKRLAVSNGKWEHAALIYGYQWERCNTSGGECSPIGGATNANYTPQHEDLYHTLRAKVTATNAGGSTAASTAASVEIKSEVWHGFVSDSETADPGSAINAVSCLPESSDCVVSDSKGNALYATNVSSKAAASWSSWSGPGVSPSEAVDCPTSGLCLLAAGSSDDGAGNLYYASSLGGSWSEAYSPAYGVDTIACVSASLCIDGQDAYGDLRASTKPASTSWSLSSQGTAKMNAATCLSSSFCVLADSAGRVHVAASASKIESGSWTETDVDGSTAMKGVACISKTSCIAVDGAGNVLLLTINSETGAVTSTSKSDIDGSTALTAISCSGSVCATVDNKGNVFVTSNGGSSWSKAWELGGDLTSVSCASSKLCLTAGTSGQVTAFNPNEETKEEAAQQSPQAGTTIEYNVPVSGSNAPPAMGATEVTAWGQKDLPVEGAAIFPEEHAQGWPASGYTGATVDYMDDEAQTVNVVNPSGGIATTEYHKGAVVRALSADNRERALKEAKPAEAAEKLATISKYSTENNELTEVTGPEHKVKLSDGEEVEAHNHVRYFYGEGAPENSKGEVEEYGLVTKTTDGALLGDGEEKDVRTTLTGYSGEKDEGWELHAATSTTTEPDGVDLVSSTKYNKETGAVEETRTPGGNAETVSPPEAKTPFGTYGSGSGQMNEPVDTAVGPEGDVFVVDQENRRIEKFTSSGTFVEAFTVPSVYKELDNPNQVAIGANGDMYIADTTNNRVVVLNKEGKFVEAWTHPDLPAEKEGEVTEGVALDEPVGVAVTPAGRVFVSNYGSDEVLELNEAGKLEASFGGKGAIGGKGTGNGKFEGPGLLTFSEGVLYVTDTGNKRVEKFAVANGGYIGQFGSAGTGEGQFEDPAGIAVAPATGDLYVSDEHENRVEQFSPAGKFLASFGYWGSEDAALKEPEGLAVSTSGKLYVADTGNNRVAVWSLPEAAGLHETYSTQFGTAGSGPGEFEYAAAPAVTPLGHVLVTDVTTNLIQEFSSQGKYLASYGGTGESAGKFEGATGIAVNQATGDMYVGDCGAHSIQELNPKGEYIRSLTSSHLECPGEIAIDSSGNVWTGDMSADQVEEFSEAGSFLHVYGEKGEGDLQFNNPAGIIYANKDIYIADSGNNRVQVMSTSGAYIGQFGSQGTQGGEFEHPEGLAADAAGDVFVLDTGNDRIQEFSPTDKYIQSIGTHGVAEGQLNGPQSIAVTAADDIYVTDAQNHRVEKWIPAAQAVHDTKTIYYTPEKEASVEACQNKPQWAGLVCQTEPLAQPTDSSAEPKEAGELPRLPVVRTEYNMWLQPVKSIETIGSKTRTKTTSYEGERAKSQALEATGKPTRTVSGKYSETLGALVERRSEETGQESKTITQQLNTLGQLESYTDAEGNATTYSYDQYGRPEEINYDASKLDHLADRERLRYEAATGQLAEIEDLGGEGTYKDAGTGTYKPAYGVEGELASETYPNNMTATYGYNSIGEGTSLTYVKNNYCTGSECEWFHDTLTPSVHGEAMSQTSNLATEQYRYEQPGRLAEVKETPAGEDCTAQLYAQNEEGDRTSLTTRPSGSSECTATEGGNVERHTYDEANRNTDEGVQYELFGNITKLPAADAGGQELTTEYYPDGQVQSQTQDETTNNYGYDPEGRTLHTETIKKLNTAITIAHYSGPGSSVPSWSYNQTAGTINRNVAAFGGLVAVEEAGKEALLQIRDLEGNVVGTAVLSESASHPHTLERATTYGVPTKEKPEDKYNWLGTGGITSSLSSGTIVQDGATYVPQLGAPLQTQGTPEPAIANVVTPFVITVAPFVPLKYVEAVGAADEGGTPSGNMPGPGGENSAGCTGLKACAAGHHKKGVKLKCELQTGIVIAHDEVLAFAMGRCGGAVIPSGSKSEVCLWGAFPENPSEFKGWKACAPNVGNNDTYRYAAVKMECGSDLTYTIWGWFWMPGWRKGIVHNPEEEWKCKGGKSAFEEWEEPIYFTIEMFEGISQLEG
ncbi:MAG TPA: SMP-30/gluconolactonase/LRE family protein [Solirubrobacteraceae bacterium]|jgi:YD repeat-containing protein|nr:SMP-30/gluconolactonase/LRE family protein [Solirubrobacteraceae bacterium]